MIKVPCPQCGAVLKAPDSAAGRVVACPQCGNKARVPGGGAAMGRARAATGSVGGRVPCPSCGEPIPAVARKCRYCGRFVEPSVTGRHIVIKSDTGRHPAIKGNTARNASVRGDTGRNPAVKGNTARNAAIRGDTGRYSPVTKGAGRVARQRRESPGRQKREGMMCCLKAFFHRRADASDRVTRREWWLTNLGIHLFIVVPYVLALITCGIVGGLGIAPWALIVGNLLSLLSIPLFIALAVLSMRQARCRAHDAGKSGAFGVLMNLLVPFGGVILGCMPGTPGENEYGPDAYGDPGEDDEADDEGEEYDEEDD